MKVFISVLLFLSLLGCPQDINNKLEAKKRAQETAAMMTIRKIHLSQTQFRMRGMARGKDHYASSMKELARAKLMDSRFLTTDKKGGYIFKIKGNPGGFEATAAPATKAVGDRFFYINQRGVLRYADGKMANAKSPRL